jgi:hypothetical protein
VSSPFNKKGGTATKSAPADAAPAADDNPRTAAVASVGEDSKPVAKADPFAGGVADPGGTGGYKPGHFMGQLVLMHFTEVGRMKTVNSGNEEDGKSPFTRVDLIPLTLPETFGFTNKYGEYEECDPFEVGERLDDNLFFNKPLVREGKRALDRQIAWVLGRIQKGARKEGQDAPVILVAATDEDKAIFEAWRQSA